MPGQILLVLCNPKSDYSTRSLVWLWPAKELHSAGETWKDACDRAILVPQYPWEGKCVEGPSVIPMVTGCLCSMPGL